LISGSRPHARRALLAVLAASLACATAPATAGAVASWRALHRAEGQGRINDITPPNASNVLTISSGIHLWHVFRGGKQRQFVRRNDHLVRYLPDHPKIEPYIAQVPAGACGSFRKDDVFGLMGPRPKLMRITPKGKVRTWRYLPRNREASGLIFDTVGAFGNRLLITERNRATGETELWTVGCPSREMHLVTVAPKRVEGGLTVAPVGFGQYGGWLLGPNESSSTIYAFGPAGQFEPLPFPGLNKLNSPVPGAPVGGDIGIESLGTVPLGLGPSASAYMTDRRTPGNIAPGKGVIRTTSWPALQAAGAQPGDVLAASEKGGHTFAIECPLVPGDCTSVKVAQAASATHVEGHIVFAPGPLRRLR
jgi:hypothetical protein